MLSRPRPSEPGDSSASPREEKARQTQEGLIDAGLAVADRVGLAGMSVNLVVREAGVAKGTFFHHFPERRSFLVALYQRLHARLFEEISRSIAGVPPGASRLARAADVYLDECLARPEVRTTLFAARAEPSILREISSCQMTVIQIVAKDFKVMGWPSPIDAARLWCGLCVEGALLEHNAGCRQNAVRSTLRRYSLKSRHSNACTRG